MNYQRSKDIISMAFSLVAKFEEIAKRVEEVDAMALIENEWGVVNERVRGVLSIGRDVGVERYKRMLHPKKDKLVLEGDVKEVEESLFRGGEKTAGEGSWGAIVRKHGKAWEKLVKSIEVS